MTTSEEQERNSEMPIAIVTHAGQQFRFTHDDPADHIFSILKRTGTFYESTMLQALTTILRPMDLVLDVGANIGTHTVFFAGACSCRVVAFEPNPRALRSLQANLRLNDLQERVKIEPVAVGAARQRGALVVPAEHNLGTGAVQVDPGGDVEIMSIDDVGIDGKVALIKVDIEGKDAEVLRGASKLLDRDHPAIVIEAKSAAAYGEIARLLDPLGYVVAGSFNYSPTHLFVRPPARTSKARLIPELSHQSALQYIDSMSRQSVVDQRLGRLTAQMADTASKNEAGQKDLATQRNDLQRVVDDVGKTLSTLTESLQDQKKGIETQVAAILQQTTATTAALTTLRQDVAADIARHAAANNATTGQLHAAIRAIHDQQMRADERLANAQSRVEAAHAAILQKMESVSAAAAADLAVLRQVVSEDIARHAAANDRTVTRLEKALQALDGKSDAAIEAILLAAASVESDVGQLRKELVDLVDQRLESYVRTVITEHLQQLRTDIAQSVGRQFGELRIDLDALLGKANMSFVDTLALLGIDSNNASLRGAAPSKKSNTQGETNERRADAEVPLQEERRTWYVRRGSLPGPATASAAPTISGELLARFDFDQGWKDQAWGQRGTELRARGLVVAVEDKANLGFVSRLINCSGGGLLEIEVSTSTVEGADNGRILRIRSDADEAVGHDFPLADGETRITTFAPFRTERINIYVLRPNSPSGTAFRAATLIVKRIPGDQHQVGVSAQIGQPVFASVASIPSRRDMLRDCVSSLLVQCDRVRVFLNEYPDVPAFLDHPRVEVRRSQDWDDRGDAGKFFWIDRDRDAGGYRLIADDDLIFPPEFAATMTGKVAALDNKAVFAAHGVLLRQPIGAYYETSSRATTFHFGHQLDQDRGVHIGATNAMCFHAGAVQMRWSDFKYCNSADLWLSLYARDKGLPVLTPARPRGWIRENHHASPNETIYIHSLKRTRSRFDSSLVQDAVIRHAKPFTLQALGRAKCAFYMHVTHVDEFRAAIQSWLSWRTLDVEWVVVLAHDKGDAGTATAVKSLEIPHEVHVVEIGRDLSSSMAALCEELGVEAAFCAGDAVRFSPVIATDTGSVMPPGRDAMDLEPLVAGPTVSHERLTIQSLRGARSGKTQAFVMAQSGDRLCWLVDLVGRAAVGQARSPLDTSIAIEFKHETSSNAETVPAIARNAVRLNEVFERVLVLNLDRRRDRWKAVSQQFERFGIQADRMCAVDGLSPDVAAEYEAYSRLPLVTVSGDVIPVRYDSDLYLNYASQRARIAYVEGKSGRKAITSAGAWGYLRSYEGILEQALEEQTESLVVFDDDVVLHNDFQAMFDEAIKQLPSDWLIVQLGTLQYNWSEPWVAWRSSRLYQTNGAAVGSHAVGMRFDIYPFLLDQVRRMDMPYDIGALSAATRAFPDRCFVIHPNLAIQWLNDTDIGTSEFQRGRGMAEIAATYRWKLSDYQL